MIRQLWLFARDGDLGELLSRIEAVEPGLLVAPGRYLRGDPSILLKGGQGLEFPELDGAERRRYLFHRAHSKEAVSHEVVEGPLEGCRALDETRSDCLLLVLPREEGRSLAPARLSAETYFMRGTEKVRKSAGFVGWAAKVLRALRGVYSPSGLDFVQVAPRAMEAARGGELRLCYLGQPIDLAPDPQRTLQSDRGTPLAKP